VVHNRLAERIVDLQIEPLAQLPIHANEGRKTGGSLLHLEIMVVMTISLQVVIVSDHFLMDIRLHGSAYARSLLGPTTDTLAVHRRASPPSYRPIHHP